MRLSIKRTVILIPSAALLAAFAALLASQQGEHEPSTASPEPVEAAQAAEKSLSFFRFQAGKRYTYAFKRSLRISGLAGQPVVIGYQGNFFLDVVETDGGRALSAIASDWVEGQPLAQLAKIRLTLSPQSLQLFTPERASEHHSENQDSSLSLRQANNVLRDLISQWAFFPNEDTIGPYEAKLEILPNGFQKTKRRYTQGKTSTLLPKIIQSKNSLVWISGASDKLPPEEISGNEETELGEGKTTLTSLSSYELRWIRTEPLDAKIAPKTEKWTASTLALETSRSAEIVGKDRFKEPPHWDSLLARLTEIDSEPHETQLQIFGQLAQLMRDPDSGAVAAALSLLRAQGAIALGLRSGLFNAVVGAFTAAGTPEAQAAVIQVYQDPSCSNSTKGAILSSLTTMQSPVAIPTRDFLSSALTNETDSDLASGAAFALGASLQGQGQGQGQAADSRASESIAKAIDQISENWSQAVNSGNLAQRLTLLDAMGNSGRPEYLPQLTAVITDPENEIPVKAKALFALRFIPGEEPVAVLQSHLNDTTPQLSQAAASALLAREQRIKN